MSKMAIWKNIPLLRRAINIGYTMLLIIALSAIVGLILAFPIKWLWNYIFGELYKITVMQAWALSVLSGIIFGRSTNGKK